MSAFEANFEPSKARILDNICLAKQRYHVMLAKLKPPKLVPQYTRPASCIVVAFLVMPAGCDFEFH